MYRLTDEGKQYLKQGLPEERLLKLLEEEPRKIKSLNKEMDDLDIAINWAKKKNLVEIEQGKLKLRKKPKRYREKKAMEKVNQGEEIKEKTAEKLLERNLITEIREDIVKKARKQLEEGKIRSLTPELIQTKLWKEASLKKYNVKAKGKKTYPGKKHLLTYYINKVRRIFLDMGFEERKGSYIESSFWNFDALYTPQDHPAREMQDTFFIEKPEKVSLPDEETVEKVKNMHEKGDEESKGWNYEWSREEAQKPVLRTHTTPVTVRSLKDINPPAKVFSVDRAFRNETLDYSHIPEFTQVEGIVVSEEVNFKNLLGYLEEFFHKMGFEKARFRPGYFPYTEMSVEPEVYLPDKGEWLELGGAGIFRPEVTKPMGIEEPVLAWGLGFERLAMVDMGIEDIRNFYYENDLKLLREKPIPKR